MSVKPHEGRVTGKVAVVTGGASGIGAATARILALEGARVVIADVQCELGESVAANISPAQGQVTFIEHDVASESSWERLVASTEQRFGGLHVLVNNAAISIRGSVEEQDLEGWRRIMAVNLDGVFLGNKLAIPAIRRTGAPGSIVNISSILGMVGSPTAAAYVASKGAVRLLSKSAALHCAKSGYPIRVNSIHPGWIRTPMSDQALVLRGDLLDERAKVAATVPAGRIGEPEDIAYGVLYLASDESQFVTGAELVIDGGYCAQ
jgi:NAD(P)-dependent dehydrogenase (short-subunit alcohol dehydrogenase family)